MDIRNRMGRETFTYRQVRDAVDRALANEVIVCVNEQRIARRAMVEASAALRLKRAKEKA